jgi:uncharacterized membrane protein YjdF
VDSRRLLLGDWTPVVRDGIDLLRLVLVGGAVGWAVAGDVASAVYLACFALLVLLARLVQLPRVYDLAFTAAMAFQAYAEVTGVYDAVSWFDRLVHVTLPLLTAPVVYIGLARLDVVPDPRDETHLPHYVGVGVVTAALGLSVGALWEIVEWASDALAGTDLSEGNPDTVGDLVADTVGSALGAALLVLWTLKGWGSVRRIPGVNTREDVSA